LKLRHVLDIVRVLDLHPLEFFRILFREPFARSPFLRRLDALVAPGQPAVAFRPAETEIEEIRRCLFELARKVEMLKPPERPVRNPKVYLSAGERRGAGLIPRALPAGGANCEARGSAEDLARGRDFQEGKEADKRSTTL
jgi:hypothetical protein